ncbi:hypothetical protein Tco_1544022, partial [Tanacetum coccineum]
DEWHDILMDSSSKEEALKQKDIYEISWGNATQRMVEQATTVMFRKRRNNTMRDNLMIMLKNCQFARLEGLNTAYPGFGIRHIDCLYRPRWKEIDNDGEVSII